MSPGASDFVVLFDIDGTLVGPPDSGSSAGFEAMNAAAERLTGSRPYEDVVQFAGRTDPQIARALLELAGERDPLRERVFELLGHYLDLLERNVADRPYALLGDPRAAVAAVERGGGTVGLGTGNVARGARIKFESAGIGDLFDLERGGFGDDGAHRFEVLAAGARRCDPSGSAPVVVVGDTPHDVEAALAIDALCIGVPFRANTADLLREAGAHDIVDAVGPDLVERIRALGV